MQKKMKECLKAKLTSGLVKGIKLFIAIIRVGKYKFLKIILYFLLKLNDYMPFFVTAILKKLKLELKFSTSIKEYFKFSPDKIRIYCSQTLVYSFSKPTFWPFLDRKHFKNIYTSNKDFFFMN